MVTAAAEEAGDDAKISHKGRRAVAVMQLLNGIWVADPWQQPCLCAFGDHGRTRRTPAGHSVAVRRRLDGLDLAALRSNRSGARGSGMGDVTVGAQFDRRHYSWDQSQCSWGRISPELCNKLLNWGRIERRIVFQGYEFSCRNCGMDRCISINRMADTQSCDGCGVTNREAHQSRPSPVAVSTQRGDRHAVDQGCSRTSWQSIEWWHRSINERAPLFGVLPGVQLTPRAPGD